MNNFLDNPYSFIPLNDLGYYKTSCLLANNFYESNYLDKKKATLFFNILQVTDILFNTLSFNKVYAPKIFCLYTSLNVFYYGKKTLFKKPHSSKKHLFPNYINTIFSITILTFTVTHSYRTALIVEYSINIFKKFYSSYSFARLINSKYITTKDIEKLKKLRFEHFLHGLVASIKLPALISPSPQFRLAAIVSQIALSAYYTHLNYNNLSIYDKIGSITIPTLLMLQNRNLFNPF